MQYGLLAVYNERVPGIVPALESSHGIDTLGEDIDDGPFAFVAPLSADNDDVTSHLRPHCEQQHESRNDDDQPEASQLPVVELRERSKPAAPSLGCSEWQETFENQIKSQTRKKIRPSHGMSLRSSGFL
jgi:hypothetical protein